MKLVGFLDRALESKDGVIISFLFSGPERGTARHFAESAKYKDKKLNLEVKEYRQSRSLNANAYLWALLEKIAVAVKSDRESVYKDMLRRYGVFTHIIVKPALVGRIQGEWRCSDVLGEVTTNGQTGVQIRVYFGSSTYDTKEMARLIDGVVSECRELGIETLEDEYLKRLKEEWCA